MKASTRKDIDQAVQNMIKWSSKPQWAPLKAQVFEEHMVFIREELNLSIEAFDEKLGKYSGMLFGIIFEDFVSRRFGSKQSNAIDDYLKRKGSRETSAGRIYLRALRDSKLRLYEASTVSPGEWVELGDLMEPTATLKVYERSGTQNLKKWDCLVARVIRMGAKNIFTGGILSFSIEDGEKLQEQLKPQFLDEQCVTFSHAWLRSIMAPAQIPEFRNSQGDCLLFSNACFSVVGDQARQRIIQLLDRHSEWSRDGDAPPRWSWLGVESDASYSSTEKKIQINTYKDGAPVLGEAVLSADKLTLSCNSKQRIEQGVALLDRLLDSAVTGKPWVVYEDPKQIIENQGVSGEAPAARNQGLRDKMGEEAYVSIITKHTDDHYRAVLDKPLPMLGGLSPRECAKTDTARYKVINWLKLLENNEHRLSIENKLPIYDTEWIWVELGLK